MKESAFLELPGGRGIWTNIEQIADGTPNSLKAGPFGSSLKKEFYVPNGYKIYGQELVTLTSEEFESRTSLVAEYARKGKVMYAA